MRYQVLTAVAVGFLLAGCGADPQEGDANSRGDAGALGGSSAMGGAGGNATTATGGASGGGGASPAVSTGGAGATGGASGTGGAKVYPACSSSVVGTGCTMFVSTTKTLTAYKDGRICNQCAPFLPGDAECTADGGKYLCVHSCDECEFKCVAPGCKP